jgi:SAM-dependent methyltransferase
VRALSLELFGDGLALPALPRLRSVRGLGIGDSDVYAARLEEKFDYHNTFFHREPRFDIAKVPEAEFGRYDFVTASEVFEHVAPPAESFFRNACRLLRPNGVLVFTVPYSPEATTAEHFPELHEYAVAKVGDQHVLVNRTKDGRLQVYEDLVFHGGPGAVLEMRVFSEGDLKKMLLEAGFLEVYIHGEPCEDFGIVRSGAWSLPIAARKGEFAFSTESARELIEQWNSFMRSGWVRLGTKLKVL